MISLTKVVLMLEYGHTNSAVMGKHLAAAYIRTHLQPLGEDMSTTSVAPEQQRSSSGRTTPRRPSRHCALDDASFDDLVAMGQNIDDLPVEDYGTTADIDVFCCLQMNDIDQLQPYLSRISTGKMAGSHSDTMGEYHCLHTDSSECRKSPASRLLNYDKLMSPPRHAAGHPGQDPVSSPTSTPTPRLSASWSTGRHILVRCPCGSVATPASNPSASG